ncbi:MAG: hypothetical protein ACRDI3_06640 [Actinomycetota bacterium]
MIDLAHTSVGGGVHFEMLLVGLALVAVAFGSRKDKGIKPYVPPLLAVAGIVLVVVSFIV